MLKKTSHLVVVISIFFSVNVYSQTWCPTGATWYYDNSGLYYNGYVKLTYTQDTVIDSILCKEITYYSEGTWWDIFNGGQANHSYGYGNSYFTYEQSGVVYIYNNINSNNRFDTLYDINAQIGDSWHLPLYYDYGDTACADSLLIMKVINTGTQMINGFNLKTLDVSVGGEFQAIYHIIEKLGYRYDDIEYWYYCQGIIAEAPHGGLRCYSDSVFGSYSAGGYGTNVPCDYYPTSVSEFSRDTRNITIYPNPSTDKLNVAINLKQSETGLVEIFDITGKLQLSQTLNSSNTITEIVTANLSEGMCFYRINVNNNSVKQGKLIIAK